MGTTDRRRDVTVADEMTTLRGFLQDAREVVVAKVAGLDEDVARTPGVTSGTSLAGLVKHLRWVEHGWVVQLIGTAAGTNARDHDRGWEFRAEPDESLADLIAAYRTGWSLADRVLDDHLPDDVVDHDHDGPLTVRWILLHLVEETTRHAGHLDILREQADGTTGFR